MKKVVMIVEVQSGIDLEKEMGWVEESGMYLKGVYEPQNESQIEQLKAVFSPQEKEKTCFSYDIYTDDGNVAYLECNITNEEMEQLENTFMEQYPRGEEESRADYIQRFFDHLRENDHYNLTFHRRPDNSIFNGNLISPNGNHS